MPSTITSYVIFVAGTKAKSGEMNSNNSNHRGDLLPINENTGTASNHSHALGATDHFWTGAYIETLNLEITTGAQVSFAANTAGGIGWSLAGALSISAGTTVDVRSVGNQTMKPGGGVFAINDTTSANTAFRRPVSATYSSAGVETNSGSSTFVTSGAYSTTLISGAMNHIQLVSPTTGARIYMRIHTNTTTAKESRGIITLNKVIGGATTTLEVFEFYHNVDYTTNPTIAAAYSEMWWPVQSVHAIDVDTTPGTTVTYEFRLSFSATSWEQGGVKDCRARVIPAL